MFRTLATLTAAALIAGTASACRGHSRKPTGNAGATPPAADNPAPKTWDALEQEGFLAVSRQLSSDGLNVPALTSACFVALADEAAQGLLLRSADGELVTAHVSALVFCTYTPRSLRVLRAGTGPIALFVARSFRIGGALGAVEAVGRAGAVPAAWVRPEEMKDDACDTLSSSALDTSLWDPDLEELLASRAPSPGEKMRDNGAVAVLWSDTDPSRRLDLRETPAVCKPFSVGRTRPWLCLSPPIYPTHPLPTGDATWMPKWALPLSTKKPPLFDELHRVLELARYLRARNYRGKAFPSYPGVGVGARFFPKSVVALSLTYAPPYVTVLTGGSWLEAPVLFPVEVDRYAISLLPERETTRYRGFILHWELYHDR